MSRAFRSSSIAVTYIARQFGVQINVDSVADAVERSGLSTPKQFANYFYDFGINVKLRKFSPAELVEKKYIYPCVGVMRDGRSLILAGIEVGGGVDDSDKEEGNGLLDSILGGSKDNVANMISGKSGIDVGDVMNILKVAAPIIMGYLGKENAKAGNGSAEGLQTLLEGFTGKGKEQGMLESLLDGDNDGSVLDDVAGMLLNNSGKSGGLGGLLGGFLGKK